MRVRIIMVLSLIFIWGVISIFIDDLVTLVNASFVTGIIAMVIVAIMHISQSSLYKLFISGFKTIKEWIVPENRGMKQAEEILEKDRRPKDFKERVYRFVSITLFWTGAVSILFSLFVLFVIS